MGTSMTPRAENNIEQLILKKLDFYKKFTSEFLRVLSCIRNQLNFTSNKFLSIFEGNVAVQKGKSKIFVSL